MEKSPLDDLSFFKFPELTPEIVRNIVILFVVIALTIVVTMLIQRYLNRVQWAGQRRESLRRLVGGAQLTKEQKSLLVRLLKASGVRKLHKLVIDAMAYETAAARMATDASPEELVELGKFRRMFHQNVINPALRFVNTRQLLPDLPLRLLANFGRQKLDLYCSLLDIDEQLLYFDLNYDGEILRLLRSAPNVTLVFWREGEGETVFQLRLEAVQTEEDGALFRARHEFRSEEAAHRADFRLSVNIQVHYTYIQREALQQLRDALGDAPTPVSGKGKMADLSAGGASFYCERPLALNGIAQLNFNILRQPVRLMLEVTSNLPLDDGRCMVRGRWRGTQGEGRTVLNNYLSREQMKRLREKEAFHFNAEA